MKTTEIRPLSIPSPIPFPLRPVTGADVIGWWPARLTLRCVRTVPGRFQAGTDYPTRCHTVWQRRGAHASGVQYPASRRIQGEGEDFRRDAEKSTRDACATRIQGDGCDPRIQIGLTHAVRVGGTLFVPDEAIAAGHQFSSLGICAPDESPPVLEPVSRLFEWFEGPGEDSGESPESTPGSGVLPGGSAAVSAGPAAARYPARCDAAPLRLVPCTQPRSESIAAVAAACGISLKPYQAEDYARLLTVPGAVLAHDPGMGKTWAAFTLPLARLGFDVVGDRLDVRGRVLIVAPGDLLSQIAGIGKTHFKVTCHRLRSRADVPAGGIGPGFYLASYTELALNGGSPTLAEVVADGFDYVIIDEAVRLKASTGRIATGLRRLHPRYRLALTGTPVKNRLKDVFWLCWWAAGGRAEAHPHWPFRNVKKDRDRFASRYLWREHSMNDRGTVAGDSRETAEVSCGIGLRRLLAPVILARTKAEAGIDLPPLRIRTRRVPLGAAQAVVYGEVATDLHGLNTDEKSIVVLQSLRLAAAAPGAGSLPVQSPFEFTPKLAAALELIAEASERFEPVVVFSAFREPLDVLSRWLRKAGVHHAVLDGRMSQRARAAASARFRAGKIPVLLAGIDSMAEGHSWPHCPNLILMDYSWAWDKYVQAIQRVHRLDSPGPVTVWCLVCAGTIEEQMERLLEKKGLSARRAMGGEPQRHEEHEGSEPKLEPVDEIALERAVWPGLKRRLKGMHVQHTMASDPVQV